MSSATTSIQNDCGFYIPTSSKMYLWNPSPIGETLILGNPNDRIIKVTCTERTLRLAHKHVLQKSKDDLQGFLLGSIEFSEEDSVIQIELDRFDPGTSSSQFRNLPSIVFPTDIVVPFRFLKDTNKRKNKEVVSGSKEQFELAFQMLHESVTQFLSFELCRILAMSLYCLYDDKKSTDDESFTMQFFWNAVFISSCVYITPVKSVPIIPTALAKTLANSVDFIQEDSIKTGIMTMDQTRKLLLMLESDPKLSTVTAVGIWVSYVSSIYHPAVWVACLRFLSNHSRYKKVFSENEEFLLVVYVKPNSQPSFYKCSAKQLEHLSYDFVAAEHLFSMKKNFCNSNQIINITLDYFPTADDLSRNTFEKALQEYLMKKKKFLSNNVAPEGEDQCVSLSSQKSRSKSSNSRVSSSKKNQITTHKSQGTAGDELQIKGSSANFHHQPSPVPQPISNFMPSTPTVLEPSLIMVETHLNNSTRSVADNSQKFNDFRNSSHSPLYAYQHVVDDSLVPSFYGESTALACSSNNALSQNSQMPFLQSLLHQSKSEKNDNQILNSSNLNSSKAQSIASVSECDAADSAKATSQSATHLSIELQPWYDHLPPGAQQFYIDQEERMKELLEKISKLDSELKSLLSKNESSKKVDCGVQVSYTDCTEKACQTLDISTSMGPGLSTCDVTSARESTDGSKSEAYVQEDECVFATGGDEDDGNDFTQSTLPDESNGLSESVTNKEDSEFSSIQLNSSALIGSNNNPSVVSSLKAVDLPGLDSTADDNSTPRGNDFMNQNSPVLGESASMYLASKACRSKNLTNRSADDADQEFFGNLLKQVQEMLDKDEKNIDGEIETDRVLASTDPAGSSFLPPATCLLANRATFEACDLSTLLGSNGANELSLHANAIAMKYLTDEQLTSIATKSNDDATSQVLNHDSSAGGNDLVRDEKYSGLSLLSPSNMSLATKKYMQKYGLVSIDEDKENVFPSKESQLVRIEERDQEEVSARTQRKFNEVPEETTVPPSSTCSRMSSQSQLSDDVTSHDDLSSTGWSQLKDNLGETFDMLLPFLSDLEKNQQSNPLRREDSFKPKNMDEKERVDGKSGETVEEILSPRILKTLKKANKKLQKMREKKHARTDRVFEKKAPSSASVKAHSYSQESRTSYSDRSLMPAPGGGKAKSVDLSSSKERACSVDRLLRQRRLDTESNHRRMSSSPTRSLSRSTKHRRSDVDRRKDSFERVLNSQIMQAFHKERPVMRPREPLSEASVDSSSSEPEHEENILNLKKIQGLAKLS